MYSNTSHIELLNQYKQYDYLNQNQKRPLVKILVSYIKPSFLFKSEILTPIHLGRAVERESSKDGTISDEDIKWLHKNCIGDNDFEGNISAVNRRVGFLTGTYWAWKNYDKLGNPEYFGSFGVRKFLKPTLLKNIKLYNIILPQKEKLKYATNKEQFYKYHSQNLYISLLNNLQKYYSNEVTLFEEYMNLNYGYYHELYIMNKNTFFKFCEWIMPLLNAFLHDQNCKVQLDNEEKITDLFRFHGISETRDIAYIIEILTGYFLYKTIQDKKCKFLEYEYEIIPSKTEPSKDKLLKMLRKRIELRNKRF